MASLSLERLMCSGCVRGRGERKGEGNRKRGKERGKPTRRKERGKEGERDKWRLKER